MKHWKALAIVALLPLPALLGLVYYFVVTRCPEQGCHSINQVINIVSLSLAVLVIGIYSIMLAAKIVKAEPWCKIGLHGPFAQTELDDWRCLTCNKRGV